ncbi:family 2A encapsulin nanocompartment cargo protein cysteine desulfurase [Chryseobacterium sp. CT-SW4]|uniref:family 2A encapsulin nanocompartment cargo protein cysteine desulfurase n=1 Tax=Chryseobacterium sp. SW-1 TaxID=3157343 RepID=UPI003B01682F
MSINTNPLPDINEIQNLANALFKGLPNEVPKEISLDPEQHPKARLAAENVLNTFNNSNLNAADYQPQSLDFQPKPAGVAGIGVSPSLRSSDSYLNHTTTDRADISKVHQSANGGRIPASVAGSGATPSYMKQGEHFNINDPETSFRDRNLEQTKGQNVQEHQGLKGLFEYDSFLTALPEILKLNNFDYRKEEFFQSPITSTSATPSFYFLEGNVNPSHSLFSKDTLKPGIFSGGSFDAFAVKKDFPILSERVNGKPLIWLDNAATTQKPKQIIDRITRFYEYENSNIHRAAHELAARATDAYEEAREKVREFIGARSVNEVIFVRGATEAINLVAQSWGNQCLKAGDEIVVSNLEHHANIVPWKRLADKKGLVLKVIPVDDDGQIILEEYARLLTPKTKLVAFTQVSNALGTVTPAQQMVAMAHGMGAKVLVDGAQSVSHMKVNVQTLDADWFVFSGHKVFGPTGIGVLYGKEYILNATEPWQGGGNMIQDVTFEEIQYHNAPNRFEAGTGNIADAVGLGAAIDYVSSIGMDVIAQYEHWLLEYATYYLKQIPGLRLIGTAENKASVLSFNLKGFTNDEIGKILNKEGIAVRTGHHCAQPILRRMGVETTVRPSLAFYNTYEDVDILVNTLRKLTR